MSACSLGDDLAVGPKKLCVLNALHYFYEHCLPSLQPFNYVHFDSKSRPLLSQSTFIHDCYVLEDVFIGHDVAITAHELAYLPGDRVVAVPLCGPNVPSVHMDTVRRLGVRIVNPMDA